MRYESDPRLNTKTLSLRNYLVIFLAIVFVCSFCTGIYIIQYDTDGNTADKVYTFLPSLAYILFISTVVLFLFAMIHNHVIMQPVRRLSEATRKVTQGDFSVIIPPLRRDGKKDEFELLYEDFNAMTAELASTEMLKKDFIANVSHELKTPLAVIQNYATILQSNELNESEQREYAAKIADAADRLSILVSNILQISRLENQKIAVSSKPYNLSEQLCRCALGFEQVWEEKEISFETDLDQNIIVGSDEELLDIVWNNLISNALKFTPQGGTVSITAKREDNRAVVTVNDTGRGMDSKEKRHIFDKFYQADPSRATKGNGLGLAMVKEILILTDGSIFVDSKPGEGSSFRVSIPLQYGAAKNAVL